MSGESTSFRYSRPPIESEGLDALAILSRWIEPRSEVLDLGTSTGALGRHIASRGCIVDGIELDPTAAAAARPAYRLLVEADLEDADLLQIFADRRYDAIVCADVLEHLRNPGRILEQARSILRPNGALLLSVPNIGYAGVQIELLAGEFTYRPLGILDETHLRFYTRLSLFRLLSAHGFYPDEFQPVILSLTESEFGNGLVERFPPRVIRSILEQPDSLAYQFVVRAGLEAKALKLAAPERQVARFASQLFWQRDSAPYTEADSIIVTASLDTEVHELHFPLPDLVDERTTFRFDPSDRRGFVYLHSVEEVDALGLRQWHWQAGEGPPPVRMQRELIEIPGCTVPTFVAIGDDPSLELVIPSNIPRNSRGTLIVRISLMPIAEAPTLSRGLIEANGLRESITREIVRFQEQLARSQTQLLETTRNGSAALSEALQDAVTGLGSRVKEVHSVGEILLREMHELNLRVANAEQRLEQNSVLRPTRFVLLLRRARAHGRATIARLLPKRVKSYLRRRRLDRRSRTILEAGLFDAAYYVAQNPDVVASGTSPIHHYLTFGASEGRDPHEMFDTSYYLEQNPDVRTSGVHPLLHFHSHGLPERRRPHPSYSAEQYRAAASLNGSTTSKPTVGKALSRIQSAPTRFESRELEKSVGPERTSPFSGPKTLVVSHVLPFPPRAGNEYRIHRMVQWLQTLGHEVYLVVSPLPGEALDPEAIVRAAREYPNLIVCERDGRISFQSQRSEIRSMISALTGENPRSFATTAERASAGFSQRIRDLERTFCPDHLVDFLIRLETLLKPDVLIANYVFMTRFFPLVSQRVLRIVDTIDVFSTKRSKVVRFGVADALDISAEDEAALLRRADLIVAIQSNEAAELRTIVPDRAVVTAGVDFQFVQGIPPPPIGPTILYVASGNALNVKGLRDFLSIAWPLIRREVPDARLLLVGPICDAVEDWIEGVDILGRVDRLEDLYARAKVVVNLAVAGTGLKIKTVEALSYLRPIVVWPSGIDGLSEEAQRFCDVATDWYQFARLVVRQLNSNRAAELVEHREEIRKEFSAELVYAALQVQIENGMRSAATR
jgi:SAM-dependent methyltransferase